MKRKEITQEMIDDLSKMGDKDWAEKYNTFRQYPIRLRKRLNIQPFNLQHNLREHKFTNGKEYKYCPRDGGHWEVIENFGKANNRYDGLRGICHSHELQRARELHKENPEKANSRARKWSKTESGRKSSRSSWRRQTSKKMPTFSGSQNMSREHTIILGVGVPTVENPLNF